MSLSFSGFPEPSAIPLHAHERVIRRYRAKIDELSSIDPAKLREVADWFDLVDELLALVVLKDGQDNETRLMESLELEASNEIQRDIRAWADILERNKSE